MDREIKFRGKNALSGHWVYGFLTKKKNRKNGEIYFAIAVDDCSLANTIPVHAETVGQFTGLKDVDGVDIYEGDILQGITSAEVLNFSVEFFNGWIAIHNDVDFYDDFDLIKILHLLSPKVVGNIFDNPELLEAEIK